jgi:hypothetical protein
MTLHRHYEMPCVGVVERHNKAKNKRKYGADIEQWLLSETNVVLSDHYKLSDCSDGKVVVQGTLKYFQAPASRLSSTLVEELQTACAWLERAFAAIPLLSKKTFSDLVEEMPKATSPGYPLNQKYKCKRDVPMDVLENVYNLAKTPLEMVDVFIACNKEEVIAANKNTRQINASGMTHYFRGRLLYGSLHDWMVENWEKTPFAVGCSVYYDWHQLMSPFSTKENLWIADQSQQDARMHPELMRTIFRLWTNVSNSAWTSLHEVFQFDEINSLLLVNKHVVQTDKGDKSGSPVTLYLNCFHTLILWTAYFVRLGRSYEWFYYKVFVNHELLVCGDDSLYAAEEGDDDQKMRGVFWDFDAIQTMEKRPFSEVVFCNGATLTHRGRYVRVPADPDKCLASVIRKSSNNPCVVLSQICANAELCTFLPEYWALFHNMACWYAGRHDASLSHLEEWHAAKSQIKTHRECVAVHLHYEGAERNELTPLKEDNMLSRKAFDEKHAAKFRRDGLSKAEKDRRYADYRASYLANMDAPPKGASSSVMPARNRSSTAAISRGQYGVMRSKAWSQEMDRMAIEYVQSVIDPWNHVSVIPDPLSYQGTPFTIKYNFTVTSNSSGQAAVWMRDGLVFNHAFSGDDLTDYYLMFDPSDAKFYLNAGSVAGTATHNINTYIDGFGDWTGHTPSLREVPHLPWESVPTISDVRNVGAKWRPVSGGMKIRYVGPPLSASGVITSAPIPPSFVSSTGGFSFGELEALEGAIVVPALDGLDMRLLPLDADPKFRPTKAMHSFNDTATIDLGSAPPGITAVQDQCTCDISSDSYHAMFTQANFTASNANESAFSITGVSAGLIPNSIDALGQDRVCYHYAVWLNECYHPSDEMASVMAIAKGLPASTEVFDVEAVFNIELIPDSRAFLGSTLKSSNPAGSHEISASARALASNVPASNVAQSKAKVPAVSRKAEAASRTAADVLSSPDDFGTGDLADFISSAVETVSDVGSTAVEFLPLIAALL